MAVSKRLRYEILRRDGFKCRYCGRKSDEVALDVDHVVPSSLGGPDTPTNLVSACKDCNLGKGTSIPAEASLPDIDQRELERIRKRVAEMPRDEPLFSPFPYIGFVESFVDSLVSALSGKPEAHRLAYDAMWASFPEAHCAYMNKLSECGDYDDAEDFALNELSDRAAWFMYQIEATTQPPVVIT